MDTKNIEITRVDFTKKMDGSFTVTKYTETAKDTITVSREEKGVEFELTPALDWLRDHGFDVFEWQFGARAWKLNETGHLRPGQRRAALGCGYLANMGDPIGPAHG